MFNVSSKADLSRVIQEHYDEISKLNKKIKELESRLDDVESAQT